MVTMTTTPLPQLDATVRCDRNESEQAMILLTRGGLNHDLLLALCAHDWRSRRSLLDQQEWRPVAANHVDYPHEPGRLHDCPACEVACHCTPGDAECVFEGEHNGSGVAS
jgi:hypothetical protein